MCEGESDGERESGRDSEGLCVRACVCVEGWRVCIWARVRARECGCVSEGIRACACDGVYHCIVHLLEITPTNEDTLPTDEDCLNWQHFVSDSKH